MLNARPVFAFLAEAAARGQQAVLVSILSVTGASTRNPGALMAVCEDGRYEGSFSGGCLEAAVVAEALAVLESGLPREVRYGAGSRYIDIRLPCGGGIDLLFSPLKDADLGGAALAMIDARQPVSLVLPRGSGTPRISSKQDARGVELDADKVSMTHLPPPRLLIVGQGAAVEALVRQAQAFGAAVHVLTPDAALAESLGARARQLKTHGPSEHLISDAWTATVFFFHDHEWEAPLIAQALAQPGFYIGAMGSLRMHETRCALLRVLGLDDEALSRIAAPIGLIRSSRDPEVLALSTLAQIIERFEEAYRT